MQKPNVRDDSGHAVSWSPAFTWFCGTTILLGAFLLFQVQPVISKMILPWFGGGPAVWTACMLFFQVVLLGGYAYAHFLMRCRSRRAVLVLHLALLAAAILLLPISPAANWKPLDGSRPTARILALLAANVGLPYFILASTGPLIQGWYHRVTAHPSPYRLYALSNFGSLSALLTFPLLFEPHLTTAVQGSLWSWLFVGFAVFFAGLAVYTFRATWQPPAEIPAPQTVTPVEAPTIEHRLVWLFLPALASMMLLTVTNHVCQDIAVVPFLWVVPLSLYLLSFILCFDSQRWYRRRILSVVAIAVLLLVSANVLQHEIELMLSYFNLEVDFSAYTHELALEAGIYLAVLFLVCMLCHGEVVRLAPPAQHLTSFYLMIAAGGALGGVFVALVCPQLFSSYVEMGVAVVASFMLAVGILWDDLWQTRLLGTQFAKVISMLCAFPLLFVVVRAQFEQASTADDLESVRNFYGVLSIEEHHADLEGSHILELYNGRILHGAQFVRETKRDTPTTYYNRESGIGVTLRRLARPGDTLRVGVVGLGAGTIAAYGKGGDSYCFYEINPNVVQLATSYFTFLSDSPADTEIVLGDARLSMERGAPRGFDLLVLDAFSGDAIPAHLLTREAFAEYERHMAIDGVVAFHVSNRHLDLTPVVGALADHFQWRLVRIEFEEEDRVGEASSDWILMTRNQAFLSDPIIAARAEPVTFKSIRPWTDQYSNLFQIMIW